MTEPEGAEAHRLNCVATNRDLCNYYLRHGFSRVEQRALRPFGLGRPVRTSNLTRTSRAASDSREETRTAYLMACWMITILVRSPAKSTPGAETADLM